MIPSEHHVKVAESMYTVSGLVLSILECKTGMLEVGTLLKAESGEQWKISENGLVIGRKSDLKLQKLVEEQNLYFYMLDPIGHTKKPVVQSVLHVLFSED